MKTYVFTTTTPGPHWYYDNSRYGYRKWIVRAADLGEAWNKVREETSLSLRVEEK